MSRFGKLLRSPTLTGWLLQVVQLLQIAILAPIIFTKFGSAEVAVWYLLASVNFFGSVVSARVMVTYARKIAHLVLPACDSSNGDKQELAKIIGTLTSLQVVISIANLLLGGGIGYFSLSPIISGAAEPTNLWSALAVFLISQFIVSCLSGSYSVLTGCDKVYLCNSWMILSSIINTFFVVLVTSISPNFLLAVVAWQLSAVCCVFGASWSAKKIMKNYDLARIKRKFDLLVFKESWAPIWKSLVVQVCSFGFIPLFSVGMARLGNPNEAAAFAFTGRILSTVDVGAMMPFNSFVPKFAGWAKIKDWASIATVSHRRGQVCFIIFGFTLGAISISGHTVVELFKMDYQFIPLPHFLLLAACLFVNKVYSVFLAPFYAMNDIRFYGRSVIGGIVSVISVFMVMPVGGLGYASFLVLIGLLATFHVAPLRLWSQTLNAASARLIYSFLGVTIVSFTIGLAVAWCLELALIEIISLLT